MPLLPNPILPIAFSNDLTTFLVSFFNQNVQSRAINIPLLLKELNKNNEFLARLLHTRELSTYNSYKLEKRKLEYLAGRICVKYCLNAQLKQQINLPELLIDNLQSGRPNHNAICHSLGDYSTDISISHSKDYGCAIASKNNCGIDIQYPNDTLIRVQDRYCTSTEFQLLDQHMSGIQTAQLKLSMLWSAKEAIKKMLSKIEMPGFLDMQLVDITKHSQDIFIFTLNITNTSMHPGQYQVISTIFDGYGLSFSVLKENIRYA